VAAFFAFGPFGFDVAHAWNLSVFPSAKDIILGMFAELGNLFLRGAAIVLYSVGMIFDYAVKISILDFSKYANMPGIMDGWRIMRDVVNLSFIFILLYIAIGTILQLTGFDTKKLLTSVIVIALLVNFSAVLTKVVIDASNILALEFYQKIDQPSINGQKASLAGVFVSGLKLSTVYKPYDQKTTGPKPVKNQLSFFGIIMGTFGGVLVILITSFVLLMAAVLFIYRTVALLFLIVLSPLAFVAMAFPGMQSHAAKWRSQLFSQAFFAPAYLFMIYIVAKMITSKQGLASKVGLGPTDGILGFLGGGSVEVMVYFAILIGFLVGSILVAKSMGANGAVMVEGWGKKMKGKAQGYAGGVSKRYVGRAASKANEALMATEGTRGRIAGVLRKVPFAQRGVAGLAQLKGKEIGKYKKKYSNYDERTLRQLRDKFGTTAEARTAMDALIKDKAKKSEKQKIKDAILKKINDESLDIMEKARLQKEYDELDMKDELDALKSKVESGGGKAPEKKE